MLLKPVGIQKRTVTAILGTALLAFVFFGAALMVYWNSLEPARVQQILAPYADMIGVGTDTAVEFADAARAQKILNQLRSNPQILRADIVLADRRPLATYPANSPALDQSSWNRPDGIYLAADHAELVQRLSPGQTPPARLFIRMSLAAIHQRERQILAQLSLAVGAVLGIVALLQFVLLRRWVLSPLAQMAGIAERAGLQGDYTPRMPAHDEDELGQLGKHFNALLAAVGQRETALRRLANFQRAILNDAAYVVISTNTAGLITSINPAGQQLLGRPAEELVGKATPEVFHVPAEVAARAELLSAKLGEPVPAGFETFVAEARRGLPSEAEWTLVRKDGRHVPVLLSVTGLRDERGAITGFLAMGTDITARLEADKKLRETLDLNQQLVSASQIGINAFRADGACVLANVAAAHIVGAAAEQMAAMNFRHTASWRASGLLAVAEAVLATGEPRQLEVHLVTTYGREIWMDCTFSRFYSGGQPHLLHVLSDVTDRKQAEAKLQASEIRYRRLFENMITGFALHEIICDPQGRPVDYRFLEINPAYERLTGLDARALLGRTVREALPAVEKYWIEIFGKVALTGESVAYENYFADLGKYYDTWVFSPMPGQFAVVFTDVTARKQAEESLHESRRLYEELVASVPLGVFRFAVKDDNRLVFEYASERFSEVTGIRRETVLADAQAINKIIHPEEREQFVQLKSDAVRDRAPFIWEGRASVREQTRWLHLESRPTLLPGRPPFWTGVVLDVTDRRDVEEALRQQHSLLTGTLQATADGIFAVAGDGKITSYNRQFAELWRVPQEILEARDLTRFVEFFLRQLSRPAIMQARSHQFNDTSKADTFDSVELTDGRVLERFSRPQLVEGRVVGRVWSFRDVTARHWAVAALRESEHKFKTLFETAHDAILIMNEQVFLDCNQMSQTMYGCPREKIIGESLVHFSPERQADGRLSAEKIAEKIRAALAGTPQFFEWIHARGNGVLFNAEVSLNRLELRGQTVVQAIVRDITARKQAEAARHEAEELYRTLVTTSPDGITVLDMTGCIQYSSPKARELFYGSRDAESETGRGAVEFVSPADRARALDLLQGALAGKFPANERLVMRRRDGHEFVAELNGTLLRDGLGVPRGIMVITRDVTERQRQDDELKNKNAELERFTYTVSHDLKSPLITIKGFAGALLADAAAGRADRLTDDLKRIVVAADKMSELLNGLLELSRIGRIVNPPMPVSMSKLAEDVRALLAGSIAQRQARITVQPGLPDAYGDAQRLQEVLQNLVENALKFSAPEHAPEIEIGFKTIGEQAAYFVRDHGQGIEARFHESIFGLFNKLDTRSAGTGIGLALVRRIVEFHGGTVWVESAGLGRGATFYFTLSARKALSVASAQQQTI